MKRSAACWVVLAVICVACAGAAPNVLLVQVGDQGPADVRSEINDRYLDAVLGFGEVSIRQTIPGGTVEAQVVLSNKGRADVAFEYRFMWYDKSGFELPGVKAWLPAVLSAGEARGFTSSAPSRDAVNFRLMVRMPHGVTSTGS